VRTRWDELAAPFDQLAGAFGVGAGDRALLAKLALRGGWGARPVTAPRLPSGVRHGVPWGLSVAMTSPAAEGVADVRVFFEAQADPPSADATWAAADALLDGHADLAPVRALGRGQRMWHAIGFARDRAPAFHAYVCVPDRPELAWGALDRGGYAGARLRDQLGARAKVTIVSVDLASGPAARTKLYALVPDARPDELPYLAHDAGAHAFAHTMLGGDARIGWLVCYGFTPGAAEPTSIALHFGAAVHGGAGFAARLAAYARALELPAYARAHAALAELGPVRHHFVSYQRVGDAPRVTVYFLPEAAP